VKGVRELGDGRRFALRKRQLLDDALDAGVDLGRDGLVADSWRRDFDVLHRAVAADLELQIHLTVEPARIGEIATVDVGSQRFENLVDFGTLESATVGVCRLERDRSDQNEQGDEQIFHYRGSYKRVWVHQQSADDCFTHQRFRSFRKL